LPVSLNCKNTTPRKRLVNDFYNLAARLSKKTALRTPAKETLAKNVFLLTDIAATESVSLFPNDLAIRGTLAKLDFEKKKKQLGLTDADVLRLIGVDEEKFAEWKTRILTDHSPLKRGLNL
jgi:hypothetical protein